MARSAPIASSPKQARSRWPWIGLYAACVGVGWALGVAPLEPGALVLAAGSGAATSLVARRLAPRRARLGRWLGRGVTALAVPGVLALTAGAHGVNRLGLVSLPPDERVEVDHTDNPAKDGYPLMIVETNSLGFRDLEPPPRGAEEQRVLLVGDSFVWGDGIADNAHTLGALVRAELERRAPGRYVVMSAAYPGLGFFGYETFVRRLTPELAPDVVVVGSLGEADVDGFDAQTIEDALASFGILRGLGVALGAPQRLHELSAGTLARTWSGQAHRARISARLDRLAENAREHGQRLVFIEYFRPPDTGRGTLELPSSIERLPLPAPLLYPNRRNEYWYERDCHPKALLNEHIARLLSDHLLGSSP